MIQGWLKAGVIEKGKGFAPTEEGTPQGGVISPLLMNVALHGLEDAAGVSYYTAGLKVGGVKPGRPVLASWASLAARRPGGLRVARRSSVFWHRCRGSSSSAWWRSPGAPRAARRGSARPSPRSTARSARSLSSLVAGTTVTTARGNGVRVRVGGAVGVGLDPPDGLDGQVLVRAQDRLTGRAPVNRAGVRGRQAPGARRSGRAARRAASRRRSLCRGRAPTRRCRRG